MTAILSLCMMVGGCKSVMHPGAASQFDSSTADTLSELHSVLQDLGDHSADYPKAIPVINQARVAYNLAKNDYLLWRCGIGITQTVGDTGKPCPTGVSVNQQQVQTDLSKAQDQVKAAQDASTGGTKP